MKVDTLFLFISHFVHFLSTFWLPCHRGMERANDIRNLD